MTAWTPIAAAGGWVAWSVPEGTGFRLVAWHAGVTHRLPVPAASAPFAVDLGTDARGRIVATFSRCAAAATDCRVRVVDLASGRERAAGIPHPPGASDTFASMWRGRVAFARRDAGRHRNVDQLLLWSPGSARLKVLPHGTAPTSCRAYTAPYDCPPAVTARVESLDLGARLVAYTWRFEDSMLSNDAELRAADIRTGRRHLIGRDSTSVEYCTDEPPYIHWYTPTVAGSQVWFSQRMGSCSRQAPGVARYGTARASWREASLPGAGSQIVWDDGDLYTLLEPERTEDGPPPCTQPGAPCAIKRMTAPRLHPRPAAER